MKSSLKLKVESVKLKAESLKRKAQSLVIIGFCLVLFTSCDEPKKKEDKIVEQPPSQHLQAPIFNEDSAYKYVEEQVKFGPRVPNSAAHIRCGDFLISTLKQYGLKVTEQEFQSAAYDRTMLRLRNIIGSINPEATKRIILAAHWDSRHIADKDSLNKNQPIDGANDGGSGVGVLLEIARTITISKIKPGVGIDIIFFDGEDHGEPNDQEHSANSNEKWCLGSQYWAKNKHEKNYSAYYGILLDMVGAKDAQFPEEGTSMHFAPTVVRKVWDTGNRLGFSKYFVFIPTGGITDDHSFVNDIAKIPMIDIIHYDPEGDYFFKDHHTHRDNMSVIDKNTLKAVGQTLLEVLYNEETGANF